jgi:hypothetical protein
MTGNKTRTSQLKEDPRAVEHLTTGGFVKVFTLIQPCGDRSLLHGTTFIYVQSV